MWEAFIVGLVAGIAASPHCLGMCGGFPLHLAKPEGKGSPILRQFLFVMGKTFTYIFLGAIAASIGIIVFKNPKVALCAIALRIAAGGLTVVFGLLMMGLRLPSFKPLQGMTETGLIRSILGGLLDKPGPAAALGLGLGVGFLPCPLPMGMLAVSAASHSVVHGIALMAGVGLGTAPALLAVGTIGTGIGHRFSKVGMRAAGVVVLLVGLMTIGCAAGMMHPNHKAVQHSIQKHPAQTAPSCCGRE